MAVTVERLIATLEARIDKYEKNLEKAYGQTDRQFSRIERRGKMMESRMSKLGSGTFLKSFGSGLFAGAASALSIKAAQDLIDSATRIQNALKVAGLSGDDLVKVYDRLFESAQRNAVPLEALVSLYGRAAQQQKELGVSTDQLLRFTDNVALALRVAGTDAGAASGALLQLGQALGSGTVHAEEFNSILEGAPTIVQAAAVGIKEAGGSVAALKNLVVSGKVSSKAFFDGFAAGADTLAERAASAETTISGRFVRLQNILVDTAGKFDKNSNASQMFGRFLDDLGVAIRQFANSMSDAAPAIGEVERILNMVNAAAENLGKNLGSMTGLDQVGPAITKAFAGVDVDPVQKKLGDLQKTVETLQDAIKFNTEMGIDTSVVQAQLDQVLAKMAAIRSGAAAVVTPMADRSDRAVSTAINDMVPFSPITPIDGGSAKRKRITLADYPTTGTGGRKGARGGAGGIKKTADDRFAEDVQNIKDRTEALRMETEALGLSYEEQEKRKVQFDLEKQALKDVQEAARRKGETDWQSVQLSKEQKEAIDSVSSAYAQQAEQLRQAQEAQQFNADVLRTAFDGVRSALEDGKITMQEWGQIGLSVLDKLIDKIEDDLIDSLSKAGSGGGGGGLIGTLISGIGHLFGFASGTANTGGSRGEPRGVVHGQEAVIPLPGGGKVPVQITATDIPRFQKPASDQQSVHVTVGVAADNNGNLLPFVESVSERKAGQMSTAAIGRYDKGLPARIAETMERNG